MKWLIYGISAALLFGFWGLFDKLSAHLNPFTSNLVIYLTATIFASLVLLTFQRRRVAYSKYSIFAGICAGIGNFFILYALLKNLLILVLPFVSLASAVFFIIIYFTEKPAYTKKQKTLVIAGLLISVIGIFIISTGSTGFLDFFEQLNLDASYIVPAILIMLGFGLWTYFTYKSVAKESIDALTYNFWNLLASFVIALISVAILNTTSLSELASISLTYYLYPALAGICIAGGTFFTYKSFKTTTTKTKLQEIMVAILANGELIPLIFLSYFVLGEWATEGFIGVVIVLIGLFIIHYAEVSK